jgi:hypothetical protein
MRLQLPEQQAIAKAIYTRMKSFSWLRVGPSDWLVGVIAGVIHEELVANERRIYGQTLQHAEETSK